MAILFSCPYCTASIKVPDNTAGKLGECPKCGTRIRIPAVPVSTGQPVANAPVATRPVIDPAQGFPLMTGPLPAVASQVLPEASTDPFDFSGQKTASPTAIPVNSPSKSLPRPNPRSTSTGLLIAVIVGVLALIGVAGWIYLKNRPVYSGAIAGARIPTTTTPLAVAVPWATIGIDQQTQMQVIEYFKRHKSSIISNMLTIEVGASTQGLEIRFLPTPEAALVSVDPRLIPDLKQLITQNEVAWNAHRLRVLVEFSKELCVSVAKAQQEGTRVENLSSYRDVVAINALVRGLGRYSQAVTNNTVYPCVFEDKEGKLYFVVPAKATELSIVEKSFENQNRMLPSQYRIQATIPPLTAVTRQIDAAPPAPAESKKTAPELDTEMPQAEEKPAMEMKSM